MRDSAFRDATDNNLNIDISNKLELPFRLGNRGFGRNSRNVNRVNQINDIVMTSSSLLFHRV